MEKSFLSKWAAPIIRRAIISCLICLCLKLFLLVFGGNGGDTT